MMKLCEYAPKHLSDIRDFAEVPASEAKALSATLDQLMDHLRDYRFKQSAARHGSAAPVSSNHLKEQLTSLETWFRQVMPSKRAVLGFDEREIARLINDGELSKPKRIEKLENVLFEIEDRVVCLDLKLSASRNALGHLKCSTRYLSDVALYGVLLAIAQDPKSLELLLKLPPEKDPLQDRVA
ncbi:hypothetical protein [Acanthopleuribacter pedis]|uniref:Uncharacterized protein n=1 Tax=Acanthopleuribacter pedis TaxID=442870 RepID=A0A8J7QJ82_9BACT|nr:hypothetical protein [Acanthopleuribacter pedis]MBO1323415.1 hypothetical protein [Acanthopleuribacter pedis]